MKQNGGWFLLVDDKPYLLKWWLVNQPIEKWWPRTNPGFLKQTGENCELPDEIGSTKIGRQIRLMPPIWCESMVHCCGTWGRQGTEKK